MKLYSLTFVFFMLAINILADTQPDTQPDNCKSIEENNVALQAQITKINKINAPLMLDMILCNGEEGALAYVKYNNYLKFYTKIILSYHTDEKLEKTEFGKKYLSKTNMLGHHTKTVYLLQPGESLKYSIDLKKYFQNIKPGKYKISITLNCTKVNRNTLKTKAIELEIEGLSFEIFSKAE